MGRLPPIALACALASGCSGADDGVVPDAGDPRPIPSPDDPNAATRNSPLETLIQVTPRLEGTRAQALLLSGVGAILAGSGRRERADQVFASAVALNPDAEP